MVSLKIVEFVSIPIENIIVFFSKMKFSDILGYLVFSFAFFFFVLTLYFDFAEISYIYCIVHGF